MANTDALTPPIFLNPLSSREILLLRTDGMPPPLAILRILVLYYWRAKILAQDRGRRVCCVADVMVWASREVTAAVFFFLICQPRCMCVHSRGQFLFFLLLLLLMAASLMLLRRGGGGCLSYLAGDVGPRMGERGCVRMSSGPETELEREEEGQARGSSGLEESLEKDFLIFSMMSAGMVYICVCMYIAIQYRFCSCMCLRLVVGRA